MTKIWKETGFVSNDPWVIETEETRAEGGQQALLDIDAMIARADESNDVGLGVVLKPADDVARLEPYLYRLELVAISFPAFSDGRGFSQASLLRGRLGFANEIRAVGDVLIDQIPLMIRCGFDSFAVTNATALKRLEEGRLTGIDNHYQPTVKPEEKTKSYSWRRVAKPVA